MLTYITTSNLYWDRFELDSIKEMPFTDAEIEKCTVKKGDLLVCEGGDIGRSAIWCYDNEIRIQNHIHRLRSYISLSNRFYYYVLYLWKMQERIGGQGIGLQGLSSKVLHKILVPLPTINEQQNIVDKLDYIFDCISDLDIQKDDFISLVDLVKSKILDLAIQGKLVPQDPNDEPASLLLERIRVEKEKLIKEGKIKRDKKESIIFKGDDNSYYLKTGDITEPLEDWELDGLPDSWSFCCLGEICDYGNCVNVATVDIDDSAWILDLEDIEKDTGIVLQKVRKAKRNSISTKHLFHKGQVLYSKLRPYLNKVVLADEDGYCTSEILPLDFQENIIPQYARYYLMSPTFLQYTNKCSYGVKMPRLGTVDGKKAIITIPPLDEQKRIVEAIETIFAEFDEITNSIA